MQDVTRLMVQVLAAGVHYVEKKVNNKKMQNVTRLMGQVLVAAVHYVKKGKQQEDARCDKIDGASISSISALC